MAASVISQNENSENPDLFCLELCKNPLRFEPVSRVTNVFFDDTNFQIFAVRSGGATGVAVKGPNENSSMTFRMEDKGTVISIKFSPDQDVLAIQRSQSSVEFANFMGDIDVLEYSQNSKSQTNKILGFIWVDLKQIAFVTDHGVELYQVIPERRNLKLLKTQNFNTNWFVYSPTDHLLLLSCGTLGNQMYPIQFKNGNMYKLPKFDVDLPNIQQTSRLGLLERDVILANIYYQACVVILRHQPRCLGTSGAEVVIYTFQKEGPARKTDILKLDKTGRFAINIVDNLIIVHHQASKTSMVFDIKLHGESDGYVTYHRPVAIPLSIQPFILKVPVVATSVLSEQAEVTCELYSPNWVVFQPNVIIDAKLGCLWYINIRMETFLSIITDKGRLLDFLLNRTESKLCIVVVCKDLLQKPNLNMMEISKIFDKLNVVCKQQIDNENQVSNSSANSKVKSPIRSVVDQSDMYTHVFTVLLDDKDFQPKTMVAVVMEYLRSLCQYDIGIQHFLYELVINALLQQKAFYQLHQLLQYQVVGDSKPMACLLLSLKKVYPPADQLAIDMLKRLEVANEEIIEILLFNKHLVQALRFVRSAGMSDTVSARKFLEAAMQVNDPIDFYSVFKFFEQRNIRMRGSPTFVRGEQCDLYVRHFEHLFGQPTSVPNYQVAI